MQGQQKCGQAVPDTHHFGARPERDPGTHDQLGAPIGEKRAQGVLAWRSIRTNASRTDTRGQYAPRPKIISSATQEGDHQKKQQQVRRPCMFSFILFLEIE